MKVSVIGSYGRCTVLRTTVLFDPRIDLLPSTCGLWQQIRQTKLLLSSNLFVTRILRNNIGIYISYMFSIFIGLIYQIFYTCVNFENMQCFNEYKHILETTIEITISIQ